MPKRKRWKCPVCDSGILGPQRLRKNDVRRYCLPCSEKTGKLVERLCPALEKRRALAAEKSQAKANKRRRIIAARERNKWYVGDVTDVRLELRRIQDVICPGVKRDIPRIVIRRCVQEPRTQWGSAMFDWGRIAVSMWPQLTVSRFLVLLLHEALHSMKNQCHSTEMLIETAEAARKLWGVDVKVSPNVRWSVKSMHRVENEIAEKIADRQPRYDTSSIPEGHPLRKRMAKKAKKRQERQVTQFALDNATLQSVPLTVTEARVVEKIIAWRSHTTTDEAVKVIRSRGRIPALFIPNDRRADLVVLDIEAFSGSEENDDMPSTRFERAGIAPVIAERIRRIAEKSRLAAETSP